MRAIAIDGFGGPDVLKSTDVPEPALGPDSVLIRVVAAGVNPVDTKLRQGAQKDRFPFVWPVVLGWDVSGSVEAVGPAVLDFKEGDEVVAYCRKDFVGEGAYAELVTVIDRAVAHRGGIDPVAAGGLPLAGLAAYQALHDAIDLQAGETVIIRGASGGVGAFAVQIARAFGARVLAVAGGEDSEAFVRELGAEEFIDYHDDAATRKAGMLVDGGADALVDLAGPEGLDDWAGIVRDHGRIASLLAPGIAGSWDERGIRSQYVFVRPDGEQLAELVRMHDDGGLQIPVAETFALKDAVASHRRVEAGGARGKVILTISSVA